MLPIKLLFSLLLLLLIPNKLASNTLYYNPNNKRIIEAEKVLDFNDYYEILAPSEVRKKYPELVTNTPADLHLRCRSDAYFCFNSIPEEYSKSFLCTDFCPNGYVCCKHKCFKHKVCLLEKYAIKVQGVSKKPTPSKLTTDKQKTTTPKTHKTKPTRSSTLRISSSGTEHSRTTNSFSNDKFSNLVTRTTKPFAGTTKDETTAAENSVKDFVTLSSPIVNSTINVESTETEVDNITINSSSTKNNKYSNSTIQTTDSIIETTETESIEVENFMEDPGTLSSIINSTINIEPTTTEYDIITTNFVENEATTAGNSVEELVTLSSSVVNSTISVKPTKTEDNIIIINSSKIPFNNTYYKDIVTAKTTESKSLIEILTTTKYKENDIYDQPPQNYSIVSVPDSITVTTSPSTYSKPEDNNQTTTTSDLLCTCCEDLKNNGTDEACFYTEENTTSTYCSEIENNENCTNLNANQLQNENTTTLLPEAAAYVTDNFRVETLTTIGYEENESNESIETGTTNRNFPIHDEELLIDTEFTTNTKEVVASTMSSFDQNITTNLNLKSSEKQYNNTENSTFRILITPINYEENDGSGSGTWHDFLTDDEDILTHQHSTTKKPQTTTKRSYEDNYDSGSGSGNHISLQDDEDFDYHQYDTILTQKPSSTSDEVNESSGSGSGFHDNFPTDDEDFVIDQFKPTKNPQTEATTTIRISVDNDGSASGSGDNDIFPTDDEHFVSSQYSTISPLQPSFTSDEVSESSGTGSGFHDNFPVDDEDFVITTRKPQTEVTTTIRTYEDNDGGASGSGDNDIFPTDDEDFASHHYNSKQTQKPAFTSDEENESSGSGSGFHNFPTDDEDYDKNKHNWNGSGMSLSTILLN